MEIDFPTPEQLPALRQLWQEAFGDSEAFLNAFYSAGFHPRRCRLVTLDGEIAAALYWFDCHLGQQKMAYLYAVATAARYRRRGLCRALLEDTHALLAQDGYSGALLVPDGEALARMYAGFGYRYQTGITEFTCQAAGPAARLQPIGAADYAQYRRQFLPERGVLQEGENLSFLSRTHAFYLGEDFLLAAQRSGSRLQAAELLGSRQAAPGILQALGCEEGVFRTPGQGRNFAMFLPLKAGAAAPSYFGLAFD